MQALILKIDKPLDKYFYLDRKPNEIQSKIFNNKMK